jgi:curved DNA-binding protein CbpA
VAGAPRHHEQRDLYKVLGLSPDATRADIVRAYHLQARAVHPDARPQDPSAPEVFRALTDAYDVLSDPGRRNRYDHLRALAPETVTPRPGGPRVPRQPPGWPAGQSTVPLRAGPVHVEPPAGSAGRTRRADDPAEELALLADLINRFLHGETGWRL